MELSPESGLPMNMATRRRVVATIAAVVTGCQVGLWAVNGRSRLPAAVARHEFDLAEKLVKEQKITGRSSHDFLVLSGEICDSLKPHELRRIREQVARFSNLTILTESESLAATDHFGDSQELWDIQQATTHMIVTPRLNTPLVAIVSCWDGGGCTVGHGHKHSLVYVLGFWIPVRVYDSWVS